MQDKTLDLIEADIRATFETGIEAWNRGDVDTYLAEYCNSERTRWVTGGRVIQGKDAIASAVRARYPSPEAMGKIQLLDLDLTILTDTDALAFGQLLHTLDTVTRELVFTVYLSKIEGEWLIVSDHTSASN